MPRLFARDLLAKKILWKYLKLKTIEEYQWHLRYLDHNFVGVMKVYCVEGRKDFESTTRDHSKNAFHNLFANFF